MRFESVEARSPGDVPGHISLAEGQWLSELAVGVVALEIGCFRGRSTAFIASTARSVVTCDAFCGQKKLRADQHAVDFARVRLDWSANMASLGFCKKVTLFALRSEDAYDSINLQFGRCFGLIFVDGGHDFESVAADTRFANLLLSGGTIAFHDYFDDRYPDVRACVDSWAKTVSVKSHKRIGRIAAFGL